ncbi:hypothetical protein ACFL4H_00350 [Candidatus Neomarinimicrobiota bacterium]
MPKRNYHQVTFMLGMNNFQEARHIRAEEVAYLDKFMPDKYGTLRNMGDESTTGMPGSRGCAMVSAHSGNNLFFMRSDYDDNGHSWSGCGENASRYLVHADSVNSTVDIYTYDGSSVSWDTSVFSYGGASGAATFVMAGNHLRCGNASHIATNFNVRWGYFKKEMFWNTSSVASYTVNQWDRALTSLRPIAAGACISHGNSYTTAPLATSGMPTMDVQMEYTTSTSQPEAEWQKNWHIGVSLLYEDETEGPLRQLSGTCDYSAVTNISGVKFNCKVGGWGTGSGAKMDYRLTHAKVYIRATGDEEWLLQAIFDFQKGGAEAHGVPATGTTGWTAASNYYTAVHSSGFQDRPNTFYSYKTETGHEPNVPSYHMGATGEGYKTGVVINNKLYVGNTIRKINNELVTEGDAIYSSYSVNQYDKFLLQDKLIVAGSDGESIVRLMAWGDRLLEFKQDTLRVVNLSDPNFPFLDGVFQQRGIPNFSSATATDKGIVFANEYGLFIYNDSGVTDLLERDGERVLSEGTWDNVSLDTQGTPQPTPIMVGYLPNEKQILVIRGATAYTGHIMMYDIATGALGYGSGVISTKKKTNFIIDDRGRLMWMMDVDGSNARPYYFDPTPTATNAGFIRFSDNYFNSPGLRKYVYGVIIRYKSSVEQTNPIEYALNGSESFTNISDNFDVRTSWKDQWYAISSKQDCESIQFQLDPNSSGTVEIASFTIVARVLKVGRIKTT